MLVFWSWAKGILIRMRDTQAIRKRHLGVKYVSQRGVIRRKLRTPSEWQEQGQVSRVSAAHCILSLTCRRRRRLTATDDESEAGDETERGSPSAEAPTRVMPRRSAYVLHRLNSLCIAS